MSRTDPGVATTGLSVAALGIAFQAGLVYLSFRHPRYFWPLMTIGLSAGGLPGLRRLRKRPQPTSIRWLLTGAATGLVGYGITAAGAAVVGRVPQGGRWLARVRACTESVPRPLAALLVVPASIGEELFWREWLLGQELDPRADLDLGSIVRSTLVYAAVQAASLQPLPSLGAVLLGFGAVVIRLRSGSIWPAVAAHLVYAELCLVEPGLPRANGEAWEWSKSTT
ncbi:MAG: type II CAAX endopeptidase family protein [Candidatus Dormiibacterota bacterium]